MNWQAWATEITFVKVKHYLKKAQYTSRTPAVPKLRSRTEARLQFTSVPESNLIIGTLRLNDAVATRTSLKKMNLHSFQSLSQLFLPTYFVKCRRTLLELSSLGPYPSSEREIKFRRCLFTSSIEREIRHFHVVVVQKRANKCTKKRVARAKMLFCL